MTFYHWFLIVISVIALLFAFVVFYFWKFAIVRKPADKKKKADKETVFDRLYMTRIKSGIEWFKNMNPTKVYTESIDGLKLASDYLPAENPKGTIIVVHGYRSSNVMDFSCVFEIYHSWGYNILAVHDRAHGESEGKYIGFGILDRYDVRSWIDYVVNNIGGNIVLDGLSMGASTVLMTSGFELPSNVKCIIADCGFTSPWEECKHVLKHNFNLPAFPLLPICSCLVKLTAGYSLNEYSTLEALKTNKLPVLFIHGGGDSFVPAYMGHQNYETCTSEKEFVLVDDAEHAESFLKETDRCTEALKTFLDKHVSSLVESVN